MAEAVALASGRSNIMGQHVAQPTTVIYLNLEDDLSDQRHRGWALMQEYGVDQHEIGDRLRIAGFEQVTGLRIATVEGRGKALTNPQVVDAIEALIRKSGAGVLIVDPLVKAHGVLENSNEDMDVVMDAFKGIASRCKAAIHVIHHSSKASQEAGTPSARGATSIIGSVRVWRSITRLSPFDVRAFGLSEDEGKEVRRVRLEASNHGTDTGSFLFKVKPVKLQAPGLNLGYDAAVVERWQPPKDAMTQEQIDSILKAIGSATPRADAQAGDWIGHIIGDVLKVDSADKDEKARLKSIVARLFKDKYLTRTSMEKRNGDVAPAYEVAPDHKARLGIWTPGAEREHGCPWEPDTDAE